MAELTVQHLSNDGTAPDFNLDTPSASDTADIGNGLNTFVVYRNVGSGGSIDVVVNVPGETFFGELNLDNTVAVAQGGEVWIPLRRGYADPANAGKAVITTAGSADLDVALVRLA